MSCMSCTPLYSTVTTVRLYVACDPLKKLTTSSQQISAKELKGPVSADLAFALEISPPRRRSFFQISMTLRVQMPFRRPSPYHAFPSVENRCRFLPTMSGHYSPKKQYSPTRQFIPRRFLEPWKILVAVVVLFLLFFFRFDAPATSVVLSPSDVLATGSQQPVGYRTGNESRIAIVTFTTDQKTFTHLSLKNKYRMSAMILVGIDER